MTAMPERARDDQPLQLRCGCRETQEALANLHQLEVLILQVGHDLAGERPVIADLLDSESGREFADIPLDKPEIGGVSWRGCQEALVPPDVVRHPVSTRPP